MLKLCFVLLKCICSTMPLFWDYKLANLLLPCIFRGSGCFINTCHDAGDRILVLGDMNGDIHHNSILNLHKIILPVPTPLLSSYFLRGVTILAKPNQWSLGFQWCYYYSGLMVFDWFQPSQSPCNYCGCQFGRLHQQTLLHGSLAPK